MFVFEAKAAEPTSSLEHLLVALFSQTEHFVKSGCHHRASWPPRDDPLRWSGGRRAGSDRDRAPRYVHPGIRSRSLKGVAVMSKWKLVRERVQIATGWGADRAPGLAGLEFGGA